LACDERLLRQLPQDESKYAHTLVMACHAKSRWIPHPCSTQPGQSRQRCGHAVALQSPMKNGKSVEGYD
ncbi:MAG: hypothetical protein ACHP7C_04110, partial [Lysobacterales bacterium]